MRRAKLLAACLALLLAGAALGGGAAFAVFYRRTGRDAVMKVQRIVDRLRRGDTPPASAGGWAGGSAVPVAVEVDSSGWDAPVGLVFPATPPASSGDVRYYVAEMGGAVRYRTLGGETGTLAEGLLDFEREPLDEIGLMGLAVDEPSGSAFITLTYWDEDAGVYRNRVDRLALSGDGKATTGRETVLDMAGEATVPSYNIHFVSVGPDGMLYVGVGSGANKVDALDLDKFAGKVLRMTRDGQAPPDNPFFDPGAPGAARSYVFAYGLRNPFDLARDPHTGAAVVSDVGPGIDRIVRLEPGVNYCFGDSDDQMRANALYTWGPNDETGGFAPVGLAITDGDLLAGRPSLYVGLFGSVHLPGPNNGKRLLRFDFNPAGHLDGPATDLAVYTGSMFASVVDVEAGPDGLYFTDLWGESHEPHDSGGVVYRVARGDPGSAVVADDGAGLTGRDRFEWLLEANRCYACHVLDGRGHVVGPPLTGYRRRVIDRLESPAYAARLDDLRGREGAFFAEQRPVYDRLGELGGAELARYWTEQFLRNPRFDNPKVKMPSYDHLSDEDIELMAEHLLR